MKVYKMMVGLSWCTRIVIGKVHFPGNQIRCKRIQGANYQWKYMKLLL